MNKSSTSAMARVARKLWWIRGFKVINLGRFREGHARSRLMHVLSKASRLFLRHRGDDRSLRVVVRGGVPDTLHIDRAVAPAVPTHDDGRLVAESRVSARFREDGATSTDPRQKHTVGTIDEDIILCIKGGTLESGNEEWKPKWYGATLL